VLNAGIISLEPDREHLGARSEPRIGHFVKGIRLDFASSAC